MRGLGPQQSIRKYVDMYVGSHSIVKNLRQKRVFLRLSALSCDFPCFSTLFHAKPRPIRQNPHYLAPNRTQTPTAVRFLRTYVLNPASRHFFAPNRAQTMEIRAIPRQTAPKLRKSAPFLAIPRQTTPNHAKLRWSDTTYIRQ